MEVFVPACFVARFRDKDLYKRSIKTKHYMLAGNAGKSSREQGRERAAPFCELQLTGTFATPQRKESQEKNKGVGAKTGPRAKAGGKSELPPTTHFKRLAVTTLSYHVE